jgi:hypothetical protein
MESTMTLKQGRRVFMVVTSVGKQQFCNLDQLDDVLNNVLYARNGYYKVYHFWDNAPKVASRKYLKEMADANRITLNLP